MTEQTLTPAQELRAAASKIRDIAHRTSHTGPWVVRDWSVMTESGPIAEVHELGDAEHIGLWHPGVAALVADLLEDSARMWLGRDDEAELFASLTIAKLARAINGEVAA